MAESRQFSAIVLAGGRSSRMGHHKAALDFGGAAILARMVAELSREFNDIFVVTAPASAGHPAIDLPKVTTIADDRAYEGPVDALARGLDAIRNDAAFACSCDLPMLNARVARALCAMLAGDDAVIPVVGGKHQPLHAVYRRRCADALRAMELRGEKRLTAIADAMRPRIVGEDEIRAIDPELRSFLNVNEPADYARALKIAGLG